MSSVPPMIRSLHKLLGVFHSCSWGVCLAAFVANSAHIGNVKQGDFLPLGKYVLLAQTGCKKP